MFRRPLVLAVAALFALEPIGSDAASANTIYLQIKQSGLSVNGQEFQLNNYTQNGKSFTATTALDGSSAPLLTLVGKSVLEVVVRLDGQSVDTATEYDLCDLKSDNLNASGSTQTQRLSFTCGKVLTHVIVTATPSPSPAPPARTPATTIKPATTLTLPVPKK